MDEKKKNIINTEALKCEGFLNKHLAVSSYFAFDLKNSSFSITPNDFFSIMYLERGEGEIFYYESGRIKKLSTLKKGEVFLSKGFSGKLEFSEMARLSAVSFSILDNREKQENQEKGFSLGGGDILERTERARYIELEKLKDNFKGTINLLESKSHVQFHVTPYLSQTLKKLVEHLNADRLSNYDSIYSQTLILVLLWEIEENLKELETGHSLINEVIRYIDLNFTKDISLEDIARGVKLNISYMQKLFKQKMGNTVYDYLTLKRIDQAVVLMKSTNLPLIDICIEVGFQNRQTFHKCFKKMMGYSPKLFRKFLTVGAMWSWENSVSPPTIRKS